MGWFKKKLKDVPLGAQVEYDYLNDKECLDYLRKVPDGYVHKVKLTIYHNGMVQVKQDRDFEIENGYVMVDDMGLQISGSVGSDIFLQMSKKRLAIQTKVEHFGGADGLIEIHFK